MPLAMKNLSDRIVLLLALLAINYIYMKIEKKIRPEYFEAIKSGKTKCDLRLADFECNEGDVLVLKEWDPNKKDFTGRTVEKTIHSAINARDAKFWSEEDIAKHGLQMICFE